MIVAAQCLSPAGFVAAAETGASVPAKVEAWQALRAEQWTARERHRAAMGVLAEQTARLEAALAAAEQFLEAAGSAADPGQAAAIRRLEAASAELVPEPTGVADSPDSPTRLSAAAEARLQRLDRLRRTTIEPGQIEIDDRVWHGFHLRVGGVLEAFAAEHGTRAATRGADGHWQVVRDAGLAAEIGLAVDILRRREGPVWVLLPLAGKAQP